MLRDVVLDAPMCDPRLHHGEVRRGDDAIRAAPLVVCAVAEHSPAVGLLAAKAVTDPSYVGLDHFSPEDYAAWWRERGARMGRITKGRATWENEQ
jgi:hypothetical protein